MKTIYKYPIKTTEVQEIKLPVGSKPLCVQMQGLYPCIWALIETEAAMKEVTVKIYGTGHLIKHTNDFNYLGTYQEQSGLYVYHVFING